jgi:hypothetical protein
MEQFWLSFYQSGNFAILIGALVPVLGAAIVFLYLRWRRERTRGGAPAAANYPERLKELSSELARASSEVEHVLEEMAIVSRSRNEAFANLEQRVRDLAQHERDLQMRVETLKSISLPAAEYFLQASEPAKPKLLHDYVLFGAGVILSAIITLVVKLFLNL